MSSEAQITTRQATLTLLLKQGESSAGNLANSLGISVQAMRRLLRSLENQGLVQCNSIVNGRGRPMNFWQLTNKGQNEFHNVWPWLPRLRS